MDDVKFALLELLPEHEKTAELKKLKACHYRAGQTLHERGEMSDVYFLFEGKVRIGIDEADGETAFFNHRMRGEMIGFYSVITGKAQPLTAVAIEDTRAGRMLAVDFMELVLSRRALSEYMLRRVTTQLMKETNRIRQLVLLESAQRVAVELINYAVESGGSVFEIPERVELASRLGMTRETLARHLSGLQKRGLIAITGRTIEVLNLVQLADFVE